MKILTDEQHQVVLDGNLVKDLSTNQSFNVEELFVIEQSFVDSKVEEEIIRESITSYLASCIVCSFLISLQLGEYIAHQIIDVLENAPRPKDKKDSEKHILREKYTSSKLSGRISFEEYSWLAHERSADLKMFEIGEVPFDHIKQTLIQDAELRYPAGGFYSGLHRFEEDLQSIR